MVDVKLSIEGQVGSGKTIVNKIITEVLEKSELEITGREQGGRSECFTVKGEPIFHPSKDKTNQPVLAVIDDEVALEALNDNVIILEDPFRTGFECKACDGEGHTGIKCTACGGNKVVAQNTNFNVAAATLTEAELSTLPPHFAEKLRQKRAEQEQEKIVSGGLIPCQKCVLKDKRGNAYISGFQPCQICNGIGSTIIVPEDTMRRPTSGVIKSLGPLCKFLKAGDRVVFSNMMGHAINYTHKVVLRTMREDEIMMRLHGTNPEKFQRKLS